jgi:hypothetical protein
VSKGRCFLFDALFPFKSGLIHKRTVEHIATRFRSIHAVSKAYHVHASRDTGTACSVHVTDGLKATDGHTRRLGVRLKY